MSVHIGVVTDDFDSALVGANGTVTAQAPEFAAFGACRSYINTCYARQRGIGYVISDADGEVVFGSALARLSNTATISPGSRSLEPKP